MSDCLRDFYPVFVLVVLLCESAGLDQAVNRT